MTLTTPIADAVRRRCDALDRQWDHETPVLAQLRTMFSPGAANTVYLDANSIGPMPLAAPERMREVIDNGWRSERRRSWNTSNWLEQPRLLGASLARVLGSEPEDLLVCDTTSVNHFKLLCHALQATQRSVIVIERDVFPSNRYVAEGIARLGLARLRDIRSIDELPAALAPGDVAVVSLSHVDYRSSKRLDIGALSPLIRAHGALSFWDLSHSAGALEIALRRHDVDLAVACGYKYLSGGPGAPALMYVHPRWRRTGWPALAGWMGHADTFDFAADFEPAGDMGRFQVGTPAVLANAAMTAAAEIWAQVDPVLLEARHQSLSELIIELMALTGIDRHLELASPRLHGHRGGHLALRFEDASALAQALVADGVVVSARKPDALRLAPHPLASCHADIGRALLTLQAILTDGRWRHPRFAGAQR